MAIKRKRKRKSERKGERKGISERKLESANSRTFSAWTVLIAQIPLALTILGFAVIFGKYESQELGNNSNRYIDKVDKNLLTLRGRRDFDDEEMLLPVYQVQTLTVQEAREKGEQIFGKMGTKIDESGTIVYDNTLVLYSDPSRYNLWITYKGGSYSLSDFKVSFPEDGKIGTAVTGADEGTIREALARKGITVPAGARFEELSSGSYRFDADMIEDAETLINGALTCRYYEKLGIGEVRDDMVPCIPYRSQWLQSNKKRIILFVDARAIMHLSRYLRTNYPSGTKFPCKHSYERMIL